jgi:phosphatidylserine/phosphatidylglycerophosphate/cardiolipin synthase-like enzyme
MAAHRPERRLQTLPRDPLALRAAADQVFSRTAGAPLVAGNATRILRDATENYPVWADAIGSARHAVHLEMYIIHRDETGRRFVDLLAQKARQGVAVRVIYDWFGCGLGPALGLFRPLIRAGGEVRAFNPPSLTSTFGWLRRNHRKLIVVDGRVAYVSGLCIGQMWQGRPDKQQEPWRDTGIEIVGPAVAHADEAFAESWHLAGGREADVVVRDDQAVAGNVALRLIPTEPFTGNMLRLDLLVTAVARRSLWLTDAYFVGTGAYLEALRRAAADGVDVRLLVPQYSDVGWTVPVARALYRPLLEGGVRIFEWNGTMVHSKTAIADSRWARIGSTNLNINSWFGNWELDVAIEDDGVARELEAHYLEDLERSTEIVLSRFRLPTVHAPAAGGARRAPRRYRSSRRMVRAVTDVGRSIGAAVTGNRRLEDFEATPIIGAGVLLTIAGLVGLFAPEVLVWPFAAIALWTAVTFFVDAWTVYRRK